VSELPELDDAKLKAGLDFIRRTGATGLQVRYSDDELPVVWMVVAQYGEHAEVDAALNPVRATLRLCERLADGGGCTHCDKPTGLTPDSFDAMPLPSHICWYQWDPERETFRRGCEGDAS
jgi:hypothetical protein